MNKTFAQLLLGLFLCPFGDNGVDGRFNMTEYYKMPKLYIMDDYDLCMDQPENLTVYCITTVIIKPNVTLALWEYIDEFSRNRKKHFRHDRLQRGVCVNRCQAILSEYDEDTLETLYQPEFEYENEVKIDPRTFRKAIAQRALYDHTINQCVNLELNTYELMGHAHLEYCLTSDDKIKLDFLDIFFLVVVVSLLSVTIASSYYDKSLRKTRATTEEQNVHYKLSVAGSMNYRVSFSFLRNWHRLVMIPKSDIDRDLRCIHALRFITMYCVIIGHTILFLNVFPVYNPQYIELNYYRLITMILINGHTVIQTYFAISGFLLSIQFVQYKENQKEFSLVYFFKAILYRYTRMTPIYGFMVFFHSTLLIYTQSGPMWRRLAETERSFCRKNWWTNIFYLNNYVHVDDPCFQHGWYLATDFQMFIIGITLHLTMWRFPKSTKFLLITSMIISYIIPGVVTYRNKFDGIIVIRPESQKYGMWFDDIYKKVYIPTHTNMGTYLAGMVAGLLYLNLKARKPNITETKAFKYTWYAIVPTGLLLMLSAYWFYACELEKPQFWIAVYAAVMKNLWGVLGGVMIIGSAFGIGWVARDILCSNFFRPLGKITFCVYLCHPFVLKASMGNLRQPLFLSDMTILVFVSSTLILSYIGGMLLYIVLELPVSVIQKQFIQRKIVDPAVTDNTIELVHNT